MKPLRDFLQKGLVAKSRRWWPDPLRAILKWGWWQNSLPDSSKVAGYFLNGKRVVELLALFCEGRCWHSLHVIFSR